jgi:hypothetical protein
MESHARIHTARIACRRALAIIFEEREWKRRGVRIVYKSFPKPIPLEGQEQGEGIV